MVVDKIYFDLDSVLADFLRGVKEICGMEPPNQNDEIFDKDKDDEMWRCIKETDHFYDRLEFMPGAKEMFDVVYEKYGAKCEVLTGVPKAKRGITTAGDDKINWVHRLLSPDIKVNIVIREQKPEFCTGEGCVLIDDMEKNIREWEEMGGTGIVNISAVETMEKLKAMGIL